MAIQVIKEKVGTNTNMKSDFACSNVGLLIRLVIVSEMIELFEAQIMISVLLQLAGSSKIKLVPCQVDPCSLSST